MSQASQLIDLLADYFSDCADDVGYADFGPRERAIHMCRSFSNVLLKMPPMAEIERIVKTDRIINRLTENPGRAMVKRMSDTFSTDMRTVVKVFKKRTGIGIKSWREANNN